MKLKLTKNNVKEIIVFLAYNISASILYAIGVNTFTAPHHIAPGGFTGLATMVNFMFGLPIGTVTFILNIPLLLLSVKYISKKFAIKNTITIFIFSAVTDIVGLFAPQYHGETILATLFGGSLMGAGLALIHLSGSTSGGTTILGVLIKLKYAHISIGRMTSYLNMIVVFLSMLVFKNIDSGLFAVVSIFTSGKVMDNFVYGTNTNKLAFIISDYNNQIREAILRDLHRGVTLFDAHGGYENANKNVIMCVVSKGQFMKLRKITKATDERAFVVAVDAGDVLGKGFKHYD